MDSYALERSLVAESTEQPMGVRVGKIVSVNGRGKVLVDFPGNTQGPAPARFTGSIKLSALREAASNGREVLLVFENNDPARPIVLDVMHSLLDEITEAPGPVLEAEKPDDVIVDGKRITLDAKDEIVLRCGKASVILQKSGKVVIRGTHLVSASSGPNKVKGASIALN